jgi:TolB protein
MLICCTCCASALAARANAAYPGRNGVIAYHWPDPIADAAYLAFITPDGASAPSQWVQSWDGDENVLAFSPDALHAVGDFNGDAFGPLGVARAPGSRFRKITHPRGEDWDGDPSWSPDGSSLVFARYTGGTNLLYTVRADGSHLRRIGPGDFPAWSTTGQIAFMRFRHNGNRYSIYTSTASGKNVRRLTFGRYDASPDWSPDGQRVVFERYGEIATIAATGGDVQILTHNSRPEGAPAYSPDGTQIVFATDRNLIVIPSAGGPTRTYKCEQPGCDEPTWLPVAATGSAPANAAAPTISTLGNGRAPLAGGLLIRPLNAWR